MTAIEISDRPRTSSPAQQVPHQPSSSTYWLIARPYYTGIEPLTLTIGTHEGEEEVLPVFGYHEEAEMFLHLGSAQGEAGVARMDDAGWRVRQVERGELLSLLRGPCAGIKEVALDPLPQMIMEMTVGRVSVLREHFIRRIMLGSDTSMINPPVLYDPDRGQPPREGRISEEREEEREGYLVRERRTGIFRRSLQLPQEVDEEDVSARFEDGVLEVVIEGAAEGQEPKHVQVESSDGGGSNSQQEEGNGDQQR